jgi:hypothetical protein
MGASCFCGSIPQAGSSIKIRVVDHYLVLAQYKGMLQKRLIANLAEKRGELFQVFLMRETLICSHGKS